ncbi:AAA family ATPase [Mucilaginibacter antarcticus]|uniref:AAA family ATPase n=1 Tax=Mucilaginibacter antarcticus TaxID=1855725 RepID=UPI00363602F1
MQLDFGTSKGASKIQQKINSHYSLFDILSEGEQKAIALAEYLTELQLDMSQSPVIFDDPVNSLDHHIIDDVSRRLIKLSADRQVIICTHSILLFNSLLHFSGQTTFKHLEYKFYNSKTQFGRTGYITAAEEEINGVTPLIKVINALFNNTPKDRDESDIASDGYGYLRSAIEVCVEKEIFQGTVKRYQKNIVLGSFVKVNGDLINTHKEKLNELFERCSGYIKGHSSPSEIHNDPTLAELRTDFDDFKKIRSFFLN